MKKNGYPRRKGVLSELFLRSLVNERLPSFFTDSRIISICPIPFLKIRIAFERAIESAKLSRIIPLFHF